MAAMKQFKTYEEQVALLASRGMDVGDPQAAAGQLRRVNYYRLSGYWYPFRRIEGGTRVDEFAPGTTLTDIIKLYDFDTNLRTMTFASLSPVELTMRALLGHALGEIDECAHLKLDAWNVRARGSEYTRWRTLHRRELKDSREDFVKHHKANYGGVLPVWAAVEVLNWGSLTKLFGFSPRLAQDQVAAAFGLSAPQLESWLKSLNIVRNVCAHHGRLFNRVFALKPKLPPIGVHPHLDEAGHFARTFGQLTLIQHLLHTQGIGRPAVLPKVLRSFPPVPLLAVSHTGAPPDWDTLTLWRC